MTGGLISGSHTARRRHGYIAGIAAPVIGGDGAVVAAMSVSGPLGRFKTAQTNIYLPRLLAATRQVSERLGYRPHAQ